LKIGIPREIAEGETRVAVIPSMIPLLTRNGHEVSVESGAGKQAFFSDAQYEEASATIVKEVVALYQRSEVVMKLRAPRKNTALDRHEIDLLSRGTILLSDLPPIRHDELVPKLLERRITSFGMEYVPRITKAQSMDVLSSMATISGYKAVLIAADRLSKFFPLLMTAAGTIPPARVLILGAGVAGLQAIATAKRLGANVEAFDPRPAVREQVESLGAQFIEMELPEDAETAGGYAKEQAEEFLQKERDVIGSRLPKTDALITTAQIFGRAAPLLVTKDMVQLMKPGSVIVDLAAAEGGNCELTRPNEVINVNGITIFGAVNLARTLPYHASQMYSKNMVNLFTYLFQNGSRELNFDDEITKSTCITHEGEIINEQVRQSMNKETHTHD